MGKFTATLLFEVEVEVDETKFDEAFLSEFRESFYPFFDVERHVEHIAQLEARGMLDDFTEGYGPIKDMGISARTVDCTLEVLKRVEGRP
ncbi:hypothetical protein [Rhizobium laguerreae]|uniref:hypothetical protein n=1 Tax=Rhizobium laguerreae TaxID=1076926 RepID=UPI001C8FBAAB|nr:hypothetical protein [Rhizobium laguerreae]MBY3434876.1 hypothetical protein [Rhizobium laguerreae]MBY3449018.1 hypothetical protein [Rhizobium laguerreae]MBY3456792.1 hypothetical protein [Rhizobium laguerreae]